VFAIIAEAPCVNLTRKSSDSESRQVQLAEPYSGGGTNLFLPPFSGILNVPLIRQGVIVEIQYLPVEDVEYHQNGISSVQVGWEVAFQPTPEGRLLVYVSSDFESGTSPVVIGKLSESNSRDVEEWRDSGILSHANIQQVKVLEGNHYSSVLLQVGVSNDVQSRRNVSCLNQLM